MNYKFEPESAFAHIQHEWMRWADKVGAKRFVFGVSGGKDSTVIAYLAARIFGPENCYGVMMPNGVQVDLCDSENVCELTKINHLTVDIRNAYESINDEITKGPLIRSLSQQAFVNLAPRLRMATLYAVAQSVGGFVLNTDNLSERVLGYFTAYGDGAGDYAPLRDLTATEVVKLGEWLGADDFLIHKMPGDGLQPQGDEERFGFTYADLDRLIRTGEGSGDLRAKVMARHDANKFKTRIVNIPGPLFFGTPKLYTIPQ